MKKVGAISNEGSGNTTMPPLRRAAFILCRGRELHGDSSAPLCKYTVVIKESRKSLERISASSFDSSCALSMLYRRNAEEQEEGEATRAGEAGLARRRYCRLALLTFFLSSSFLLAPSLYLADPSVFCTSLHLTFSAPDLPSPHECVVRSLHFTALRTSHRSAADFSGSLHCHDWSRSLPPAAGLRRAAMVLEWRTLFRPHSL